MLAFLAAQFTARRRALQTEIAACHLATRLRQPSMAWTHGPRTQPRDGRGRLLSKAWLARAETFTAADLAWFRNPVRSTP